MDEYEAKETWDYLCQDFEVLNEFKYFMQNNEFVPAELCIKRCNYSAQQIFETTYLEEIGAFNYLIFLKNNPKRALERLKAGLTNNCAGSPELRVDKAIEIDEGAALFDIDAEKNETLLGVYDGETWILTAEGKNG